MSEVNCQQCGTLMHVDDVFIEPTQLCPQCVGMPIEADLETIDECVCPHCGALNPIEAPWCHACSASAAGRGVIEIKATQVQISRVFKDAWSIYKARFRLVFCGEALGMVLSVLALLLMLVPRTGSTHAVTFFLVAHLLWGRFIQLGQARLAVRICQNRSPTFRDLISEDEHVFPALIGYGATVVAGWLLLTVPILLINAAAEDSPAFFLLILPTFAIWVLLAPLFTMFPIAVYFVLVDQQRGWIESYHFALAMASRNWLRLYVFMLFAFAVFIAGIFTIGLALLFAVPYCWILAAVAYLHASGQAGSLKGEV